MKTQNLIKQTLSRSESVVVVQQILEDNGEAPRTANAERVREQFGFFNALGAAHKIGCLKALRELQQTGRFELTQARRSPPQEGPRRLSSPVEEPDELPASAREIRELERIRAETESEVRIWNELMIREHPRGAGRLVGAPILDLIRSRHGWLGWGLAHRPCNSGIETSGSAGIARRVGGICIG